MQGQDTQGRFPKLTVDEETRSNLLIDAFESAARQHQIDYDTRLIALGRLTYNYGDEVGKAVFRLLMRGKND